MGRRRSRSARSQGSRRRKSKRSPRRRTQRRSRSPHVRYVRYRATTHEDRLIRELGTLGYRVLKSQGGGDCVFYTAAVLDILEKLAEADVVGRSQADVLRTAGPIEKIVVSLRATTVQWMRDNTTHRLYIPSNETREGYLDRMSIPGQYGSENEVLALSHIYDRCIIVYGEFGGDVMPQNVFNPTATHQWRMYNENTTLGEVAHYRPMVPISSNERRDQLENNLILRALALEATLEPPTPHLATPSESSPARSLKLDLAPAMSFMVPDETSTQRRRRTSLPAKTTRVIHNREDIDAVAQYSERSHVDKRHELLETMARDLEAKGDIARVSDAANIRELQRALQNM